jgi:hypothetical protein
VFKGAYFLQTITHGSLATRRFLQFTADLHADTVKDNFDMFRQVLEQFLPPGEMNNVYKTAVYSLLYSVNEGN